MKATNRLLEASPNSGGQEEVKGGTAGDDGFATSPQQQLLTMKQEVDALQIQMAAQAAPWYRQASVVVAVGALVFSIATTYVSIRHTDLQDVSNAKAELRELIREISTISAQAAELGTQYESNAQAGLLAGSLLTTDKIVLANQAADIIDEVPEEVTAAEYYAVASALGSNGVSNRVLDLYERGIAVVNDTPSHLALHRGLAIAYFAVGDVESGRAAFEGALEAVDDFSDTSSLSQRAETAYTHFTWAQAEVGAGECEAALQHHTESEERYQALEGSWDLTFITPQLRALADAIQQQC